MFSISFPTLKQSFKVLKPGGVLLGILVSVPPASSELTLFQTKKMSFFTPAIQTWPLRNYVIIN